MGLKNSQYEASDTENDCGSEARRPDNNHRPSNADAAANDDDAAADANDAAFDDADDAAANDGRPKAWINASTN